KFCITWLDEALKEDAVLRKFNIASHDKLLERFRSLDRNSIKSASGRIRMTLLNDSTRPHAALTSIPRNSEAGVLRHETNKKRRHLPLRQLFAKTSAALLRLK